MMLLNENTLNRLRSNDLTLTTLDVWVNQIGVTAGAQALAEGLKVNQTLTTLNLQDNQMGATWCRR